MIIQIDKVFYKNNKNELYECFENKKMKKVNDKELKKNSNYMIITEKQINKLKNSINRNNIFNNYFETICLYNTYGLLSELDILKKFLE